MKKSLILSLFLAVLAVFTLPAALLLVNGGKERIRIREEVLWGDPAEAEGLVLSVPSHWGRQLLWDTEYTVGSGKEAESSFAFSSGQVFWKGPETKVQAGLRFRMSGDFSTFYGEGSAVFDWGSEGYAQLIEGVIGRTEKGEKHTENIRLGDCSQNYPLAFEIEGNSVVYEGDYIQNCDVLSDFFHIGTKEDRIQVTAEKNGQGELVQVGVRYLHSDEDVTIRNAGADGGEGIYFVCGLQNIQTGEWTDRGQNSGIFYLPYEEREGFWNVDLTRVRKVCDFPPGCLPVEMETDREKKLLFLTAEDPEGYHLFIYRLEGEVPVLAWQIPISAETSSLEESSGSRKPSYCGMWPEENGILLTWNDNSFVFVAEENGEYRQWCSGRFPEAEEKDDYLGSPFPGEQVCIFTGERLILAAYESWLGMDVLLTVYDEQASLYCGRYVHSGSKDTDAGYDSHNRISPQGARPGKPGGDWLWGRGDEYRTPLEMHYRQ